MRMTLKKTWNEAVLTVTFEARDAEGKVTGVAAEPLLFDRNKVAVGLRGSDALPSDAEKHGWEQRIGDKAAMSKDTKTGKPATVESKRDAMKALIDYYESGAAEWNLRGGRAPETAETLIAKLMAMGYDVSKKSGEPVDVTPTE